MEIIFTIENLVILAFLIGSTVSILGAVLKHEIDVMASLSNNWLFKNFFKCLLCTGLYILMIQCIVLIPWFGYDVLLIPFFGAGIVHRLI